MTVIVAPVKIRHLTTYLPLKGPSLHSFYFVSLDSTVCQHWSTVLEWVPSMPVAAITLFSSLCNIFFFHSLYYYLSISKATLWVLLCVRPTHSKTKSVYFLTQIGANVPPVWSICCAHFQDDSLKGSVVRIRVRFAQCGGRECIDGRLLCWHWADICTCRASVTCLASSNV